MLSATVPGEEVVLLGDHDDVVAQLRAADRRAGRCRRAAPGRRSGRRSGWPAWPAWSCRRRWRPPAPGSGRPGTVRSRSGSTGRPSTYSKPTWSKRSSPRTAPSSTGSDGLGHRGPLVEHAGQLVQGGGGRLEGVVELRDLHHRLEELAQVEQERRQHADGDVAVVGAVAAVEQHHRDGDVADQPDAGHEPADQPPGDQVGAAVLVVDVVEDLLVARLAAEGLHRADAAHRLHEVDDHQRDLLAGDLVGLRRSLAEPQREPEQERPAQQRDQAELDVEEEQQAGGADQGERRGDQPVEAGLEHLVDRVDVGGLPRDDPPGGVGVVEGRAQHLEVAEHPAPDLEEDVLADLARPHQEQLARDHLDDGRDQHDARRSPAAGAGRRARGSAGCRCRCPP